MWMACPSLPIRAILRRILGSCPVGSPRYPVSRSEFVSDNLTYLTCMPHCHGAPCLMPCSAMRCHARPCPVQSSPVRPFPVRCGSSPPSSSPSLPLSLSLSQSVSVGLCLSVVQQPVPSSPLASRLGNPSAPTSLPTYQVGWELTDRSRWPPGWEQVRGRQEAATPQNNEGGSKVGWCHLNTSWHRTSPSIANQRKLRRGSKVLEDGDKSNRCRDAWTGNRAAIRVDQQFSRIEIIESHQEQQREPAGLCHTSSVFVMRP
ncbi:hypothetical protein B0T22DRAFT_180695 [Podospora appendiculata]|uniref:Uncharacterized protein n=1 Tax=Podospora appendiculata TaxID=314037 RepID=A0AAE0XCB2_9PEZI|nr:hypothetical protein B0T22DRAFT_180695 [Podospora appendiculata]